MAALAAGCIQYTRSYGGRGTKLYMYMYREIIKMYDVNNLVLATTEMLKFTVPLYS